MAQSMALRIAAALSIAALAGTAGAAQPYFRTYWDFGGPGDGAMPNGLLAIGGLDRAGTTFTGGAGSCFGGQGCGIAFILHQPGETIIHVFDGTDGAQPHGALVTDKVLGGNLYGTAESGGAGNSGVVFELSPPASEGGPWTYQILYSFLGGADGSTPRGALLLGKDGSLYGTTSFGGLSGSGYYGNGTIYRLSPPSTPGGSWTKTTLYALNDQWPGPHLDGYGPTGTLVMDDAGTLYGVNRNGGDDGAGTVFALAPPAVPGGDWTYSRLFSFDEVKPGGAYKIGNTPAGSLTIDADGVLYGTTETGGPASNGAGTAYTLTPPAMAGQPWAVKVIRTFHEGGPRPTTDGAVPMAGLTWDPVAHRFWGTTSMGGTGSSGTVFRLTQTPSGTWSKQPLVNFDNTFNGSDPQSELISIAGGAEGTTRGGGTYYGGTAFEVVPR
jgi:uncharacterized repeat protein (TIGR03803 family)